MIEYVQDTGLTSTAQVDICTDVPSLTSTAQVCFPDVLGLSSTAQDSCSGVPGLTSTAQEDSCTTVPSMTSAGQYIFTDVPGLSNTAHDNFTDVPGMSNTAQDSCTSLAHHQSPHIDTPGKDFSTGITQELAAQLSNLQQGDSQSSKLP